MKARVERKSFRAKPAVARAGLTRSRVVEVAAALADDVGLDHLTLAALAQRLGVRPPSLYKHIDSLAGLRQSVSLRADRELWQVLVKATVGRSGADAIRSLSGAYRSWALMHPARYRASQSAREPQSAEELTATPAAMEVIVGVLAAQRPIDSEIIDHTRAIRSGLHGFLTLESQHAFGIASDNDRSFDRMVRGFCVS